MTTNGALKHKAENQLQSFLADCQIERPQGKCILEIGFKNGLFLDQCRRAGMIPTGLEINPDFYRSVGKNYPELDLVLYDGMDVPLPDETFDYIVSFQVLEHVESAEKIISECVRLLKPGGMMYHICPNYHSFYEGHYKIFWLPFFNKSMGRRYLRLLRRYTPYYESLKLITPGYMKNILLKYSPQLETLSLGRNEFCKKFTPEQIAKVDQKLLRAILSLIYKLPLSKPLLLLPIAKVNCHYPLTIIAKKNHLL